VKPVDYEPGKDVVACTAMGLMAIYLREEAIRNMARPWVTSRTLGRAEAGTDRP
jgi:hypothetical protein